MVLKVLICGGGNGAHVMGAITSSLPDCEARVLTLFEDEAERWTQAMASEEFFLKRNWLGKEPDIIKAKPLLVTKNAAECVPGSDLIVFVVPAFAHAGYWNALKPFLAPGMVVAGLPGQAGFEFECAGILGDLAKHLTLMNFESLPWACRITKFGVSSEVIGTKAKMLGAVRLGKTPPKQDPTEMLQRSLGEFPKLVTFGHIIGMQLMGTNGYIHPSIMYGKWHSWDGKPLDKAPEFYHGLDEFTAKIMSDTSDEVVAIAKKITELRPQVDLSNVNHIFDWYLRCYEKEITNKKSLFTAITTNQAYKGLTHPMKETPDGKFVPNFNYRYTTEDIPFGLGVMKGIAEIVGVKTPTMDRIILFAQSKVGKEYITADGKLAGKDSGEMRSAQRYGLNTLDKMLGLD